MRDAVVKMGRKLCSPLLNIFENGNEPFSHKPMNRTILIVVSLMFSALACGILFASPKSDLGFLIPVIVFSAVGIIGLIIGCFGNDRAVAKIWGSK